MPQNSGVVEDIWRYNHLFVCQFTVFPPLEYVWEYTHFILSNIPIYLIVQLPKNALKEPKLAKGTPVPKTTTMKSAWCEIYDLCLCTYATLKEQSTNLLLHFHKVRGLVRDGLKTEWSTSQQQRPRYPNFKSLVRVKLQQHWILHFP